MAGPLTRARENALGILSLSILGAGFVALFAGYDWFWIVWVLGFAVVLPIVRGSVVTGPRSSPPLGAATDETDLQPDF
ncbi:MAG: hypothetical protein ABEJ28_02105 [Salinigranum sp.]